VGTQTDLDIAQALAVGELGEGHAQELIETGKGLDLVVAVVALHTLAEGVYWHVVDDLGEDKLIQYTCVVNLSPQVCGRGCNHRASKFKSVTGMILIFPSSFSMLCQSGRQC